MNCNETAALLPTYGDGELDPAQGAAVEKHLLDCVECAARRDEHVALGARIRRDAPYFAAPAGLKSRLAVLLAEPRRPRIRDRWRWLGTGALAGSMATVMAWFVGSAVLEWREGADLATEAVANHVRATLSNHVTDVASSDRHTVKPWLSARLDYSPPVQDLSGEGFTLIGGRVDYLNRHAVATLVYRYREHLIDVFVRPASESAASLSRPPVTAVRGFNIVHAGGSGMDWLAVSDTSREVLAAFVARLARGDGLP